MHGSNDLEMANLSLFYLMINCKLLVIFLIMHLNLAQLHISTILSVELIVISNNVC